MSLLLSYDEKKKKHEKIPRIRIKPCYLKIRRIGQSIKVYDEFRNHVRIKF